MQTIFGFDLELQSEISRVPKHSSDVIAYSAKPNLTLSDSIHFRTFPNIDNFSSNTNTNRRLTLRLNGTLRDLYTNTNHDVTDWTSSPRLIATLKIVIRI